MENSVSYMACTEGEFDVVNIDLIWWKYIYSPVIGELVKINI